MSELSHFPDAHSDVYLGPVRVEMDRTGLAYVRFRAREMTDVDAYPLARKVCNKNGFKHDKDANVHVGAAWKLAELLKILRGHGFHPILGASVANEMGRLAAAHDYGSAAERADARMDAIEAATGKKFRPYQREDARWMEAAGSCVLANEMRTGKTPTCLAMVPPAGAIVVGPVGVKGVWHDHVRAWLPWVKPAVNGSVVSPLPGAVTITNYERVPVPGVVYDLPPGMLLVADEAQMLKNLNAGRTQAFMHLAHSVLSKDGRVILGTGTPAENGRWQEFWAMLEILGLGQRMFGSSRTFAKEWREHYRPDRPIVGPLSRVMTRRTYKEVVGYLPAFEWSERPVQQDAIEDLDWTFDEGETYADAATGVWAELETLWERHGSASDVWAAINSSPKSIGEYSRLRAKMALLKAPEASSWAYEMKEAGVPFLVCSCHRDAVISVVASLHQTGDVRCGLLVGGMLEAEREQVVQDFQQGLLDGMCVTMGTGGVGLDFSRADAVAAIDLDYVPGKNDQTFARVMSVSDPRPKTGVRLVIDHPLERAVDRILAKKVKVIADTVGQVGSGSRTYGQDLFGDLQSGPISGAPEGVDLQELSSLLKDL